jgi:hypothetical protein
MLSVANKPIMLSIIMLNVIMLSVVAPHENYVGEQYLGLYQIKHLKILFDQNYERDSPKSYHNVMVKAQTLGIMLRY